MGLLEGEALVDLCYEEDSSADIDLNLVATDAGGYVEIQGTAEGEPFSPEQLDQMLTAGRAALDQIFVAQQVAITA